MPKIKITSGGKVITKGGKPSCTCCVSCNSISWDMFSTRGPRSGPPSSLALTLLETVAFDDDPTPPTPDYIRDTRRDGTCLHVLCLKNDPDATPSIISTQHLFFDDPAGDPPTIDLLTLVQDKVDPTIFDIKGHLVFRISFYAWRWDRPWPDPITGPKTTRVFINASTAGEIKAYKLESAT